MVKNAKNATQQSPLKQSCSLTAKQIKKRPHKNYQFIDFTKRVDIIYDNFTHNLQPQHISQARNINYNTVRSILSSFYQCGRVNIKKKTSGYGKKTKKGPQGTSLDVETASQTHISAHGSNEASPERAYHK